MPSDDVVKTISCFLEDVDELGDEALDSDEDDEESTSRWFIDSSSVSDSTSSCFIVDLFLSDKIILSITIVIKKKKLNN